MSFERRRSRSVDGRPRRLRRLQRRPRWITCTDGTCGVFFAGILLYAMQCSVYWFAGGGSRVHTHSRSSLLTLTYWHVVDVCVCVYVCAMSFSWCRRTLRNAHTDLLAGSLKLWKTLCALLQYFCLVVFGVRVRVQVYKMSTRCTIHAQRYGEKCDAAMSDDRCVVMECLRIIESWEKTITIIIYFRYVIRFLFKIGRP